MIIQTWYSKSSFTYAYLLRPPPTTTTRPTKLTARRVKRHALHRPTQIRQHVLTISHPRRSQHRHRARLQVPFRPNIPLLLVVRRRRLTPCRLVRHHSRPAGRQYDQCSVGHFLHQRLERRGRHRLWRVSSGRQLRALYMATAVFNCAGEMVVSGGSMGRAASRRAMDSWAWEMRRTPAAWAARRCGSSGTMTGVGACWTLGAARLRRPAEDMTQWPQPPVFELLSGTPMATNGA